MSLGFRHTESLEDSSVYNPFRTRQEKSTVDKRRDSTLYKENEGLNGLVFLFSLSLTLKKR